MLITDLTRGSSRKMLWMFSIPMLLSVAFQQVYQIADSIIAGQFIGEAALAAVGASHPITMIFMAVAVGSNIGCRKLRLRCRMERCMEISFEMLRSSIRTGCS